MIFKLVLASAMGDDVPGLPNFIGLLHKHYKDSPFISFLYQWESLIFSILISSCICLAFYLGLRKKELIPTSIQNAIEGFFEFFRTSIISIIGPKGEKYVPFLGTLFIYIFIMNISGIVPLMMSPSANLNITLAMAICVFCLVQFLNIKNMGVLGFLYHLAGSPNNIAGWIISPLQFFVELLNQFSRPVTLALRLFGNVLGEEILIGAFVLFGIGLIASHNLPVGLPLQIPFMLFGLLTSFMQALVFTLLSAVYILLSMPHGEQHH